MKILYVDSGIITGHYFYYLNSLKTMAERNNNEAIYLLSKNSKIEGNKCYNYEWNFDKPRLKDYLNLIKQIKSIVRTENIDLVHILTGDMFLRFFGIGLNKIECKKIITFHIIRRSKLRDVSVKRIFKRINIGVVHTRSLKEMLNNDYRIDNIKHIEYPKMGVIYNRSISESKQLYNLPEDKKVLSCIGGTRIDKGLDILISALDSVENDFMLLVGGVERGINRPYIEDNTKNYSDKVVLKLDYLTDEELFDAINATDFIVLPYRKIFDGASGPLTDGVALCKTIIGPNHGSLGQIIRDNHLGYTFETENVEDLARVIDKALSENFEYDDVAKAYQESLKEENFQEKYRKLYEELV